VTKIDPGTVDVIELVVALVVKIALGLFVLGWDEKRLARKHPAWLERAWPPATRLSAIVVFQEIGLVVHYARTRPGLWRLTGLFVAFVYLAVTDGILELVDAFLR
jgi:hypothetical protein